MAISLVWAVGFLGASSADDSDMICMSVWMP